MLIDQSLEYSEKRNVFRLFLKEELMAQSSEYLEERNVTVFEGRVDRSVTGIIREEKYPQIVFEGRDRPGSRVPDILGCRSCRGSRCEDRNLRKTISHDSVDAADFLSGNKETGYTTNEAVTDSLWY